MVRFLIKRILILIPTLFIIVSLSFFLIRIAPGGPFSQEKAIPEEVLKNINKRYHLDDPLWKQYTNYLFNVVRGDLGPSFRYPDATVNELIGHAMPNSLLLGMTSLFFALGLGLLLGIIAALKQNHWQDYGLMSIAALGISIPLFVIGPLLQYIFGLRLQWLPISGWLGDGTALTIILPALTLASPYLATIARLSRASTLEVLRQDYIRTARAKGLREQVIMLRHVLKASLLPVVSYLGPAFSGIITGSIVVEQVFVIPGIGRIFIQSALNRDYTLIMGQVIVYSVILLVMNLLVDIVYSLLDPRIKI